MTATISPAPTLGDDPALAAYEATADVYDTFTAHHDYDAWTSVLEDLARRHGLDSPGELLDVGCGTGKSFLPWHHRGWSVTACDQSVAMLRHAAAKAPADVRLVEADARQLDVLGEFRLVLMLDDVVNYLAADELAPAFAGVARNLAPDGLVVFDVNTLSVFRGFFAAAEVCDRDGCFVVWQGRARGDFAPGETAEAAMDAFVQDRDGRWERRRALHREHHHPATRLERALADAGLERVATYGHDYECNVDDTPDELRHTKLIVIARRAS
ncbi:MAG TPA: class I SAM-dependent methyltransferase [Solirubrobacteraceae bacterium]|nr:class I SAM-dependent methyltransferase [Solirubrobacteraceae bacterium]